MFKKNDFDGVIENRALENRECRENKLREQGRKNEKENVPLKNGGNNNNGNPSERRAFFCTFPFIKNCRHVII